uniref:Interleukin 25 n=1 Tax=Monodelphis domestica TaxID=13616 RepID=F6SCD3_MONDO
MLGVGEKNGKGASSKTRPVLALNLRLRRDYNHHHRGCCHQGQGFSEEWLQRNSVPNIEVSKPFKCQASRDGPLNSRAISPWKYVLDRDENRLPQDLYHARCLCPHCINLRSGHDIDYRGNSELLWHNQTVFYRRPCHGHGEQQGSDCYYLEPRTYLVSFACICVLPRIMA